MVGSEWSYVSKSEWKKYIGGEPKEEVIVEDAPKKNKKIKNDRKA
jgi:hypothetical protein